MADLKKLATENLGLNSPHQQQKKKKHQKIKNKKKNKTKKKKKTKIIFQEYIKYN